MTVRIQLAILLAVLTCGDASAAHDEKRCPGALYDLVAKDLELIDASPAQRKESVVSESCVLARSYGAPSIIAAGFDQGHGGEMMLVVAAVDNRARRVLRSYIGSVEIDRTSTMGQRSLQLDPAPYPLARGVHAVGLTYTSETIGPFCADQTWDQVRVLLVPHGKQELRPVMMQAAELTMSPKGCFNPYTRKGEGNTSWLGASVKMELAPSSTKGMADILLTATIIERSIKFGSGMPRKEQHLLRYDGEQYKPAEKAPWWVGTAPWRTEGI